MSGRDRSVEELAASLRRRGKDREAGELEQSERLAEAEVRRTEDLERRLTGTTGRELQAAGFSSEEARNHETFRLVVERIAGGDLDGDLRELTQADRKAAKDAIDRIADSWITTLTSIEQTFTLMDEAEESLAEGGTP